MSMQASPVWPALHHWPAPYVAPMRLVISVSSFSFAGSRGAGSDELVFSRCSARAVAGLRPSVS